MDSEQSVMDMKRLLRRFFVILGIVGVVLFVAGLWLVHQYNANKYGIVECQGGFAHCARLHPQGVVYEWGGVVAAIGITAAGVALVSLIVLAFTKVRR